MKANHKYFILFISFFTILDQLTKLSIIRYFSIKSELLVDDFLFSVNEYLNFVIVWNKGFAFGLLQNDLFTINLLYILIISIVIIFLFFYANSLNQRYQYFIFSLLIGGAIGNLIDRIRYGAVVDFIDVHYQNLHWYVFNIADIYISFGCIMLILGEIRNKPTSNE